MLKLIVRYSSDKSPVYEIFQVANVDYAKDDLKVLTDTVLKPLGKNLKNVNTFLVRCQ